MALITNLTDRRICVTGKNAAGEMHAFGLSPRLDMHGKIDKQSAQEIDDVIAKHWAGRSQRMIEQGTVTVDFMDEGVADLIAQASAGSSKKEHWRTTIKRIEAMTDTDELERMHTAEDISAAVKAAIENRFLELSK